MNIINWRLLSRIFTCYFSEVFREKWRWKCWDVFEKFIHKTTSEGGRSARKPSVVINWIFTKGNFCFDLEKVLKIGKNHTLKKCNRLWHCADKHGFFSKFEVPIFIMPKNITQKFEILRQKRPSTSSKIIKCMNKTFEFPHQK